MALQNVAQCEMKHDNCRRTKRFVHTGQNLYYFCSNKNISPDDITHVIDGWFSEYTNVPEHWIHSFPTRKEPRPKSMVGHFIQMIWYNSFAMGCAIVKSASLSEECQHLAHLACNYATGNIAESPIYKVGPMCKECQSGQSIKFPGLCSESEDFTDDPELFTKDESKSPILAEWIRNGKNFGNTNT